MLKKFYFAFTIFSLFLNLFSSQVALADEVVDQYSYTNQNNTTEIVIQAQTFPEKKQVEVEYTVYASFFDPENRHGIFRSLPKNQNGVWTNYEIVSVLRTENLATASQEIYKAEKYETIKEWNQFRFRVGDKDVDLAEGHYIYKIKLLANYNPNSAYNFTFIKDELGLTGPISLYLDGKNICENNSCSASLTQIKLNPGKPEISIFQKFFSSTWIYLTIILIISTIVYFLYKKFAKDYDEDIYKNKPSFEPPQNLFPWQADYLVSEGKLNLKNTLMSYIFWLNNQKYVKISTVKDIDKKTKKSAKTEKLILKVLKDLPGSEISFLPQIFNTAVSRIAGYGFEKGLKASQINPAIHEPSLNQQVKNSLDKMYEIKPIRNYILTAFLTGLGLWFAQFLFINIFQNILLIGDSWHLVAVFSGVTWFALSIYLFKNWGKVKLEYKRLRGDSVGYKYYIQKAEKFKLDFSNNPDEGVQYYLKTIPFAAAFGVLPSFQKYFEKIMPKVKEIQNNHNFATNFASSRFYSPPSSSGSSSGGGGSFSSGGFRGGGGSW